MALLDERIQVDHLLVVMEEVKHGLTGDARREGADGGEDCPLRHLVVGLQGLWRYLRP